MQKLKIEFCPVTRQYIHKKCNSYYRQRINSGKKFVKYWIVNRLEISPDKKFLNYEHFLDVMTQTPGDGLVLSDLSAGKNRPLLISSREECSGKTLPVKLLKNFIVMPQMTMMVVAIIMTCLKCQSILTLGEAK